MRSRTLNDLDRVKRNMSRHRFMRDVDEVMQRVAKKYISDMIPTHFQKGNTRRQGYKPNSLKYQKRKREKYGKLPQLVVTYHLARKASSGKSIIRGGKVQMKWNLPPYGRHLINSGRNFLRPSPKERKALDRIMKAEMKRIRNKHK